MLERDFMDYDLEGPVSPNDHAKEVCDEYIEGGSDLFSEISQYNTDNVRRFFSVLSYYDDLLTLLNRIEYEPGDTLMLLIAFLVEAGVTEEDLRKVSAKARLVPGIREWFKELQDEGYSVSIISTSYEQHAFSIAERVGVPPSRVYCTKFPLDSFQKKISKKTINLIKQIREKAIGLYDENLESKVNDEKIRNLLDPFFWKELPKTELGQMMKEVKVMGGRRKVRALEEAIRTRNGYLETTFIVGDSITDFRMAQVVEAGGGIALAWNANQYMIPYASCGVAAVDARTVKPVFEAWREGGRKGVKELIERMPEPKDPRKGPYYHWLAGEEEKHQGILAIHERLRKICRGKEVAKLG